MTPTTAAEYEYIVVGSGAGGGPLAANLAKRGYRVLLIEAGSAPETYLYQVPCFHAYASEERDMAWNYFVHHYSKDEARDDKYRPAQGGVYYPRAGTLGGCTAHNAMITILPHNSDWDGIAEFTGDSSWAASNMRQYFERLERCSYVDPPRPGAPNPTGHGFSGWLTVSMIDPRMAIGDRQIIETMLEAVRQVVRNRMGHLWQHLREGYDPNDARNHANPEGLSMVPLATSHGKRNGTREYIRSVQSMYPDRLVVRMNNLATRVLFDGDNRAVGVETWEGQHLYQADPAAGDAPPSYVKKEYRCSREVILSGGAFNTPQLLMLSGIGPKQHLTEMKIACRADRPGVGRNLQDRYEVAVVSQMDKDFAMLGGATFKPPGEGEPGDKSFQEWLKGTGVYTTNGAVAAIIMRSEKERPDPDLFIFGLPGAFRGYYPGYSEDIERTKNFFTWAILKAHTKNTNGEVKLRSNDPRDTPEINFHYFDESNNPGGQDLDSVVRGVQFIRAMNSRNHAIREELHPGKDVQSPADVAKWVTDNAWGHHASCSCRMGRTDDPMAVVDSRFRVIGTKGLRVVDASVFPRIPGFFIVTPIYMISEKAADVIVEDAAG